MNSDQIRQKFLDFFANKGHRVEPSASLIPHNDKTLLFVNAGMVPFKDVFSGREKRDYCRAVSSQRCVRAGGKHNDLENVGFTARHHTFFEMLGNFSFGDYFKEEAIEFAWQFLTEELKIPADRLWVSVYEDDDDAEDIWVKKIGFPKSRISRCGAKDNFWSMGDTGPCGPCSEIFYDHGEDIAGGPPGHADEDGDRFIEIWNLVFTQFDRQADGYLKPLTHPCVDTGMGLERLAALLQGKHNNYDTDLFKQITKTITNLTSGIKIVHPSVRVIADHIRSTSFLIADGIMPSNEGRGYVLRRIIRRAIRHGHKLGIDEIFFYKLVKPLVETMSKVYPILSEQQQNIENSLKKEEERFATTLNQGMSLLEEAISELKDNKLDGKIVFKLYDTFGFPVDLTADVAREKNLTLDMEGFESQMKLQKERARASGDFSAKDNVPNIDSQSEFLGYESLSNASKVVAIIDNGKVVQQLNKESKAIIVLDKTPFYAQSGGQIGDMGILSNGTVLFKVRDTQKQPSGAFEHHGILEKGPLKVGDTLEAIVDKNNRRDIARNHSATHLLHAALREVLGENVQQKGSLVDNEKLRFDFSYEGNIADEYLLKIESMVNNKILANTKVWTEETDIENATKKGAMALFGEKYDKVVRVLTMGKNDFSVELCGGTHVNYLGDIGLFKIINQTGVAAGVRRIEAITGHKAYLHSCDVEKGLKKIASLTKSSYSDVVEKIETLVGQQKELEKKLEKMIQKNLNSSSDDFLSKAIEVKGIKVLAIQLLDVSPKEGRHLVDRFKSKLGTAIVVLAIVNGEKISLVAGVTKDLTDKYNAGTILGNVAQQLDGKAGGRADMAQGGGSNVAKLEAVLNGIKDTI
jgi:alanyl-tRNA synthetase